MRYLLIICSCVTTYCFSQKNPCNTDGKPYSALPGDTTISLASGTTVTFNRCEFFDVRDCIQILEITDPEQLRREGINMYDNRGNVLVSCGMIKFDVKDCGKKCFDIPLKIRIRVRFPDCRNEPNAIPNLYFNSGGGWSRPKGTDSRIVTDNNNARYLELNTPCPVRLINCDVPLRGRKIKFIAPKGNKIAVMRTGIHCSLFYSDEKFGIPKRKVKLRLLCNIPEKLLIESVQLKANGDSVGTAQIKLSDLKHGNRKLGCKDSGRSIFGLMLRWLSPGRGMFYRKYYLRSD